MRAVEDVKPEDAAETQSLLRANYGVHLSLTDDEMLNSVLAQ